MLKNRAGWLAISVLAIATVLMVFFVLPRISGGEKPVGEAINTAGKEVKDAVTKGGDAARELVDQKPNTTAPTQTAPPAQQKPAAVPQPQQTAKAERILPTFDVLRVEPDGSAVIAGRAEPKSKLEVLDAEQVVARTDVDKAGEFVAILDKPLTPGDHQLVLKATAPDGQVLLSQEVATVSVPQNKGGELLAMVTKPGEASRLIAVPGSQPTTAKTERVALNGATPVPQQQQAAPKPEAPAQAPAAQTSAPMATVPAATAPAQPSTPAAAPQQTAAVQPNAPVPSAASPSEKPALQVSAVEVEGDRLFIAGIAKSGIKLRGYADGQPVGEAQATGDGHFVIDGRIALSVGQHQIAVDALGNDGKALLRVEVPFNRPAGEQVAAVATNAPQTGSASLSPIDGGAFDKLRNEASRAFQLLSNLYANGNVPTAEQVAAARSGVAIALKSLTEYRLPAGADANAAQIAENTAKAAAEALAALDALPRDVNSIGKNLGAISEMLTKAIGPMLPTAQPAPIAEAQAPAPAQTQADAGQPKTIAQAPLTQSEASSVIIRRGDTLWQISRRVYGQGVRYTTIYVANQDQIANPNIIQPGQIFGVPKDAMPDDEAEKIHRKQMKKG